MSTQTSRVFIARLSGVPVFAPNGDQVGRVRDVVVTLRIGAQPRVLGLVVEVTGRRRIFVPITRVTTIDVGQVITTGVVNLRTFQQRPSETLVLGELLDRKVDLVADETQVTVLDVAIEASRTGDWLISKVYIRKSGSGIRRRGETLVVDWDFVSGFSLNEEGQGAAHLLATFDKLRPADLAGVLHELSPKRRAEVAAALDDKKLADVLEELPDDDQVEILKALESERAADVLEEMDPDEAADLLSELSEEDQERLLQLMDPEEADDVRRLLAYGDYTAGGMMTSEPVILSPDATVAQALAHVRNPTLNPAMAAQVYVVRPPLETPTGRYLGVAHFQRLLREPPSALVSGLIDTELQGISPDAQLNEVTRMFATYNLVALPVVDEHQRLLGAVTVDDVIDHMLPEDWRESTDTATEFTHGS